MALLVNLFILYLFNPVLSVYNAIKIRDAGSIKVVFLLTFFFIGYTFYFEETGADIARVVDMFKYYHNMSFDPVRMSIVDYFIYDAAKPWEFLLPVICKIISLFTGNPHLFVGFISLLYGYFYTDIFIFILNKLDGFNLKSKSLILLLYVFTISPYSFQAFRFWTAAIVFIWSFIGFFIIGKKSRLIVILIFCFLHNALFLPLFLMLFNHWNFISLRNLFLFYNLSFIIVVFQIKIDSILSQIMPSFLQDRSSAYLDAAVNGEDAAVVSSWFLVLSRTGVKYVIFALNYFSYKDFYSKIVDKFDVQILKFLFFFSAFSNVVINSEAYRYSVICTDLSFVVFAFMYFEYKPEIEVNRVYLLLTKYAYIFLIFYFVIQFRIFADFCSIYLFVFSPLTHFIIEKQATFFEWYSNFMK